MTVEEIVERGGEADDVLRAVVRALHEDGAGWVGIAFVEGDRLELGPSAGGEPPAEAQWFPVEWQGAKVAELQAAGGEPERLAQVAALIAPYCLVGWDTRGEPERLAQVAALIAPYCLVGWDTGGEPWSP